LSIGFFDSGVGGLTIWKEVVNVLPDISTVYIADSANAPYGSKPGKEIVQISIEKSQELINLGAEVIVVACNTATTQAISALREKFDVPFIGIEPAIKPAAKSSKSKCIGVLATHGTIESEHFNRAKDTYSEGVKIITQVGEGLVKLIEDGKLNSSTMDNLLRAHLSQLVNYPIDRLVLGCTHYPLLIPQIKNIIQSGIEIVDSGIPVALQVKRVVDQMQIKKQQGNANHTLKSSGNTDVLKAICNTVLNRAILDINYSSLYQSE